MPAIPNISDTLSRAIYADVQRYLPPGADNSPEGIELHNQRAMTVVAHLLPENAAEAESRCRLSPPNFMPGTRSELPFAAAQDPDEVRRCRAQASSMMRQADSGIRTLLRLQAERTKAEKELRPAAMERAGYWFKSVSVPEPEPPPAPQQPALPPPAIPPKLQYGAMTPAERYATLYPDRATRILVEQGLSPSLNFPPPDPAVVQELLSSGSPSIRALYENAQATWPSPSEGVS
jgi:hypothetical protein